jgi:hypothetical protein
VGGPFANTFSVAGTAPDDVWAVGADFTLTAPSIEHFDGGRWSEFPTPASLHVPSGGPRTIALWDVAAVSTDDAWAVGGYEFQEGAGRAQPPVVLHWDGVRWANVVVPTPEGRAYVGYGVAADGPDDVWVAADAVVPDRDATPGVLLHWDGSTWSDAPLVAPPGTSLHLQAVDSTGPDDVWAAGSAFAVGSERSIPMIEHFDGTSWIEVPLGGPGRDRMGRVRSIRVIGGEVWTVGFTALDQPPFVSVCRTRGSPGA